MKSITKTGAVEVTTRMSPDLYDRMEEWCQKNDYPYVTLFIREAIEEKLTKRRGRPRKKKNV